MKKRLLAVLPILALLASCGNKQSSGSYKPAREYGDEKTYALFMCNYPGTMIESSSGYQEMVENVLYEKVEITVGQLITKPAVDPVRENYDFKGWHTDKEGQHPWDFEHDVALGSTILYAKWDDDSQVVPYVEPEYIPPERIIDDMDYRITDILNKPLKESGDAVDLTTGGIGRLRKHADDVKFAIGFEHRASISIESATFDDVKKEITVNVSNGESKTIKVNDITATLRVSNSYYESKAQAYEQNGVDIENYHIALMGSSSMENWQTSTEDMDPIVTFNHGIGGTTVEEWTNQLFERLVMPYSPKAVVYYVGVNNIINSNKKGDETGRALEALFDKTHQYLPNAKIFYVLINKLPSYGHFQSEFDVANNMALEYEKAHDYLTCIDAGIGLLKDNGKPNFGYFIPDGLHMSKIGYVIWGGAVKKAIMDWLG